MKLTNVIFKNIKTKDVTLDDGRVIDNVELTFDQAAMRYSFFVPLAY
jgi:hypothetical protein